MLGTHWLFFPLFTVAVALAGTSSLKSLDRQLEAVHLPPSADLQAQPQLLAEAVQALQALEAGVQQLPDDQRDAGLLRLADGYGTLARDLLSIPCPGELDESQCALFRGLLAEKAEPLSVRASTVLGGIMTSDALGRADRQRREDLGARMVELAYDLKAAKGEMPQAPPPPERPEPAAPQAAPAGWMAPAGEAEQLARFAIIHGIGGLQRASGEPIVSVGEAYSAGVDQLYVVELLGRRDGLAELRLGGVVDWDSHCVPHQTLSRFVAVRAWIPESDLLPVVGEDLVVDHDDGTGLLFLPGTPVIDGRLWLHGQLFPLPASAYTVHDYGSNATRHQRVYGDVRIPWGTTGTIGGEPFALRQPSYDHNEDFAVSSVAPRGDQSLFDVSLKCGGYRFLGETPPPGDPLAGIFGALGGGARGAAAITVPAGTRLYWADGQPAGQTVEDQTIDRSELFGSAMRCVERRLGSAEEHRVALCFDPADLESP